MRCECHDKQCPSHKGESCPICLPRSEMTTLYRIDMEDVTGTDFCPACSRDAMDSGLFTDDTSEEACEDEDRITCPQCELLSINGVTCHETGCPNTNARWDSESGEWIKQRKCFTCGCTVDADDLCCDGEQEEN